jgi:hypothetical protein
MDRICSIGCTTAWTENRSRSRADGGEHFSAHRCNLRHRTSASFAPEVRAEIAHEAQRDIIMNCTRALLFNAAMAALVTLTGVARAEEEKSPTGYTDTPQLPNSRWRVHDDNRPRPAIVTPGTSGTAEHPGKPPSDAVILFDGTNLDAWQSDKGGAPGWKVEHGYVEVVGGSGDIVTRQKFGDCQLHVEFREPNPPTGTSQERGNSGVFLAGLYEIQVLDSYNNLTYADGQASAVFGQSPPLVNASRPPGEWQSYDIIYTSPRFADGKLATPGYVTVFHNGVLTQDHTQLLGASVFHALPKWTPHDVAMPLKLQDHHMLVRFRNIWIRPLPAASTP